MNNYKDLFINIDEFDEENISYIKPILFYKVSRNMGIYYKKETKVETKVEIKLEPESKNKKRNKKKDADDIIVPIPTPLIQPKKQKIIVLTPKMVVPFGIKEFVNNNKKSYQLSLSFSTLTNLYNEEDIKKFYLFMQKIDSVNESTIMEYKKTWGLPRNLTYKKSLQRLSKDYPHYMNLNLPYDEKHGFLFHVYDEKANKSTIDIIDKRSIVSVVMELTDLRFSDADFKPNWTVLQIRKMKPYSPIQDFFMSGCFICDEDDPEDVVYGNLIEKYRKTLELPIALPKKSYLNLPDYSNINQQPSSPAPNKKIVVPETTTPAPTRYTPPSLDELLDAKKSLKKTVTVIKGMTDMGKIIDNGKNDNDTGMCKSKIPPPPPPLCPQKKTDNTKSKIPPSPPPLCPQKKTDNTKSKNITDQTKSKNIVKQDKITEISEKTSNNKSISKNTTNKPINKTTINNSKKRKIYKSSKTDSSNSSNEEEYTSKKSIQNKKINVVDSKSVKKRS